MRTLCIVADYLEDVKSFIRKIDLKDQDFIYCYYPQGSQEELNEFSNVKYSSDLDTILLWSRPKASSVYLTYVGTFEPRRRMIRDRYGYKRDRITHLSPDEFLNKFGLNSSD